MATGYRTNDDENECPRSGPCPTSGSSFRDAVPGEHHACWACGHTWRVGADGCQFVPTHERGA